MSVRAMYVSNFVIEKAGKSFIITFENGVSQTSVRLPLGMAVRLSGELRELIERQLDQDAREAGTSGRT
jgi:hypothetical protein